MPESEHKYLYERLSSGDFQQLVNAVLSNHYQGFRALPLGQADGGRDGIIDEDPDHVIVFQDKWTKRPEKNPVAWLRAAIDGEADNLKRLGRKGLKKYMLVTNHPSTGKWESGTYDKMRAELDKYQVNFGIESMECIWNETLNAWVDNAPEETKWAYADMLAGWDLVRYLISEFIGTGRDTTTRKVIRKLAEVHWGDDEKVKFSQVDVDRQRVSDLFIDVNARRVSSTDISDRLSLATGVEPANGAARYLILTKQPCTLVLGAPGQGKSTLTQFLCQSYRAPFVSEKADKGGLHAIKANEVRLPIRIELGTYAAWLDGEDVFNEAEQPKRGKRKTGKTATIESYLVDQFSHACGHADLRADVIDDILELVPTIVVFDGLDEVGNPRTRKNVVAEIDRFAKAGRSYREQVRVVVTSRPNSSDLPEPDPAVFETISLEPFTDKQIGTYMQKWCGVNNIRGRNGRKVRNAFRAKAKEPYIGELAGNPMQLTILLDLLNREGDATPTDRTELYDEYMALLLTREANKYPDTVKKHQKDLKEIVPFLGWYIQSRAEKTGTSGRMSKAQVEAAMKHFQGTYGKRQAIVGELIEAASDRLWALTSKEEGTFEFDIQSLREYFAAQFLFRLAGEENPEFDRMDVLRELIRRPYWLNTARFYGGNAKGGDTTVIAVGIRDELTTKPTRQTVVAAWTLLVDGIFNNRPKRAGEVLDALMSDEHIPVLLNALANSQISPLPALPQELGESTTWVRLTQAIAKNPSNPKNLLRIDALHNLLSLGTDFDRWWRANLPQFAGTDDEQIWLRLGGRYESGNGFEDDQSLSKVSLEGFGAELVLNTSLNPTPDSDLETTLIAKILDGACAANRSIRSAPARVAAVLTPEGFYTHSPNGFDTQGDTVERRRTEAIRGLDRIKSPYADIAKKRRFGKGQSGSTFPWANTASALRVHAGRCWLASEIALIGAAHEHNFGGNRILGSTAFGADSHPTTLMRETRNNADNPAWWKEQRDGLETEDDLSKAEWAFALWAVAAGPTIDELLPEWEVTIDALPTGRREVFVDAVSRMNRHHVLCKRPTKAKATGKLATTFLELRNLQPKNAKPPLTHVNAQEAARPLVDVARDQRWLLVDTVARYE